jgi:LacI family transcriptional regulator
MRQAEQYGLLVTMAVTARKPEREIEHVEMLRRQRARAVIIAGSRVNDQSALERLGAEIESFRRSGGRVAMISQRRLPVDTVLVENRAGARALAEALCDLGYRRFAVLAGPRILLTARDRLTGFRDGLAKRRCELPAARIVHGDFTRDGGFDAMEELLAREVEVECVFAVNDVMAVGAIAALRNRGIQPGSGVAVAGFDDIVSLRDITPGLSTVRIPLEEIGAHAFDLAVTEPGDEPRTVRVKGETVLRESTPGIPRPSE